jgi:hypothetical protein
MQVVTQIGHAASAVWTSVRQAADGRRPSRRAASIDLSSIARTHAATRHLMTHTDVKRLACSFALGIVFSGCGSTPLEDPSGSGANGGTAGTSAAGGSGGQGGAAGAGLADGASRTGSAANGIGASGGSQAWIDRTAGTVAEDLSWDDVASDSTGNHLVAVSGPNTSGGDIWTSADAGATWTNQTEGTQMSGQWWRSVASDSSGAFLVVVTAFGNGNSGGEDVWTSADAGATWRKSLTVTSTATLVVEPTVASDSTGTHLALADGDIWTSADSGATWTDRTKGTPAAAQCWVDMASDASGTHLVAINAYTDIWTSADSGATWTNRTSRTAASGQEWQSVTSDSSGTHLAAVSELSAAGTPGDIWTSVDSGATWINRTIGKVDSPYTWAAVASDATGAHLVATAFRDVWTSADSGITWTDQNTGTASSGQVWGAVASDATGTHLVAISSGLPRSGPCCFENIWTN